MRVPSIRHALLWRTGLGVGALLCLLSATLYLLVRQGLYDEFDDSLKHTAALLANQVELEEGKIIFEWQEGIGTNVLPTDEGLFQYWNLTTGKTTRSPALGADNLPRFHGPRGVAEIRDIKLPQAGPSHARAIGMVVHPFVLPEEHQRMLEDNQVIDPESLPHLLVVARNAEPVHRILTRLRWVLVIGTLATLGIGYLLIVLTVRSSLEPIDQLAALIRKRTARNFDQGIAAPGALPAELVGLAEDFDALLSRVAITRNRERDFIRNAAHELRTPIAGLLATTELALSKARDRAAYIQHLESCRNSAKKLTALVSRLSALARLGNQPQLPPHESIHLADAINNCLAPLTGALEAKGITVDFELPTHAVCASSDPETLQIILNNLIDNAISYGSWPGSLRIRLQQQQDHVELAVANPLDGDPGDPERWFEPFFRRDEARNNAGSHLGIGLTLSREAAMTVGGSLSARYSDTDGIAFSLTLPAAG